MNQAQQVAQSPEFLKLAVAQAITFVAERYDVAPEAVIAEFNKGEGPVYLKVAQMVAEAAKVVADDVK